MCSEQKFNKVCYKIKEIVLPQCCQELKQFLKCWTVLTKMRNDLKQPTTSKKRPTTSKKQPETTYNE